MSKEEIQAIIHLLNKQARYEYCIENNISFSDEDYEAYIIRQSMINKDKEIERLNNIIGEIERLIINHNCDTGDIYYKYNGEYLKKSELKERIMELVELKENK